MAQSPLAEQWRQLIELRSQVNILLENARNAKLIGSSLEAKVIINLKDANWHTLVTSVFEELRYFLIVSQVELATVPASVEFVTSLPEYDLGVVHAEGEKCPRCWNYADLNAETGVCDRCTLALSGGF